MLDMPRAHGSVFLDVGLQLVVPDGDNLAVEAVLRYEADDPYAVHVAFRTGQRDGSTNGADGLVEWTFARQLLTEGVTHAVGEGDVQVWPASDSGSAAASDSGSAAASDPVVCLSLSSPAGGALFEVPLDRLTHFLTSTYEIVAPGTESGHVDLDAELALLLWGSAVDE